MLSLTLIPTLFLAFNFSFASLLQESYLHILYLTSLMNKSYYINNSICIIMNANADIENYFCYINFQIIFQKLMKRCTKIYPHAQTGTNLCNYWICLCKEIYVGIARTMWNFHYSVIAGPPLWHNLIPKSISMQVFIFLAVSDFFNYYNWGTQS